MLQSMGSQRVGHECAAELNNRLVVNHVPECVSPGLPSPGSSLGAGNGAAGTVGRTRTEQQLEEQGKGPYHVLHTTHAPLNPDGAKPWVHHSRVRKYRGLACQACLQPADKLLRSGHLALWETLRISYKRNGSFVFLCFLIPFTFSHKTTYSQTSLVVQWLRLCGRMQGAPGLSPGQRTISHILPSSAKREK